MLCEHRKYINLPTKSDSIKDKTELSGTTQQILVSKNPDWNSQLQTLPSLAETNFPILLLGPSGCGKDILAKQIHHLSPRNKGPFISVNCGALTESLIESELFGHIRGSFTGAIRDRKGAFETARGGTLFLDEIGELPFNLQSKILRALENSEIRPVGGDRSIITDIRIIAATHQNLRGLISEGKFRSDLYYRLNVISMTLPRLNERIEDFEDLLFGFCREYRVRISFQAMQYLKKCEWPGNIRELKNFVARISAMYPKQEITESLAQKILIPEKNIKNLPITNSDLSVINELEKEIIIQRLIINKGNQRQTARDLKLPKSTLYDRLKSYKIEPTDFGGRRRGQSKMS